MNRHKKTTAARYVCETQESEIATKPRIHFSRSIWCILATQSFFDRDFEIFTPLCVDMRRAALVSAQIDSGGRPPGTGDHTKAGLRFNLYGCTLSFSEMCCKSS